MVQFTRSTWLSGGWDQLGLHEVVGSEKRKRMSGLDIQVLSTSGPASASVFAKTIVRIMDVKIPLLDSSA